MFKKSLYMLIMLSFFCLMRNSYAEVTTGNIEFYYGETTEETESTTETTISSTFDSTNEVTTPTSQPPFGQFGTQINQLLSILGIILVLIASYNIVKIRRLSK